MTKRALGYVRVSTERQAERGASPAVQRERIEQYCARHGYTLLRVFEDHQSGRRADRKAYQEMLTACRQGEAEAVIVMFIDRFGRTLKESARRCWELDDLGVAVLATEEPHNPADDDGLQRLLNMVFAQRESRRTGERVRGAMAYRMRQEGWLPGRVPYGWRVDKAFVGSVVTRAIAIEPAEAEVVRRIARRYLAGQSSVGIAAELNADGITMRRGRAWSSADVYWLLSRPHNAGLVIWGRHKNADGQKEIVEVANKLPPLLDDDTLEAVRERLVLRASVPHSRGSSHLLTGLLRSGECGHAMVGAVGGPRRGRVRGYICSEHNQRRNCSAQWTNAKRVEAAVRDGLLPAADAAMAAAAASLPRDDPHAADARQARDELAATDRELLDNMRLYRADKLAEQQLAVYNRETQRKRDAAQARLSAIEREQAADARRAAHLAALPSRVRSLLDGWDAADVATRKATLQQVVERVTVWRDGTVVLTLRG